MTETTLEKQAFTPFRAVLMPYRSLGSKGFMVLMSVVTIVSVGVGLFFLTLGAWPVTAFFGLDAALIYGAFKLNYWSGRQYETIEVKPELLTITRVAPSGRRQQFEFNPYWARVQLSERVDGRTELRLTTHGQDLVFGRFLTDDERREFAKVLREALQHSRVARPQ